ncbi:MAG: hypothetical protein Q6373_025965, partial [Candidatus Sigynarchaeota archaeon]
MARPTSIETCAKQIVRGITALFKRVEEGRQNDRDHALLARNGELFRDIMRMMLEKTQPHVSTNPTPNRDELDASHS